MYTISAVLFDWCNTLISATSARLRSAAKSNTYPSLVSNENSVSSNTGNDNTDPKFEVGKPDTAAHGIRVNENAHELLKFLSTNDIKMGIVSNKNGPQLRKEVHDLGLSEYFLAIIGEGDTAENKPSPEPLIVALDMLGISPSRSVLFVGDSDSDTEAALRAGCLPVGYNNFSNKNVFAFSNFRELGAFIEGSLVRKYERTTSG
ncbi:HAD family hydrolase [Anaplasma bovis]|uniref:HAD family hydrolase n=1 Tax=Anaplasma bovis TaxID=186733 RepID=UPI002FF3631D